MNAARHRNRPIDL